MKFRLYCTYTYIGILLLFTALFEQTVSYYCKSVGIVFYSADLLWILIVAQVVLFEFIVWEQWLIIIAFQIGFSERISVFHIVIKNVSLKDFKGKPRCT